MPHAYLNSEETAANQNPNLALSSVNGINTPAQSQSEPEKLTDVLSFLVETPDGTQRSVILDEKVSVSKLPQLLEQLCRQLGFDDEMDAIVSNSPVLPSGFIEQDESDTLRLNSEDRSNNSPEGSNEENITQEKESGSLFIPGKSILCQYCGHLSNDFAKCDRCKRKFSTIKINKELAKNITQEEKKKNHKKKKIEETECVTILSSDEEDNKPDKAGTSLDSAQEALYKSIAEKEPVINETTTGFDCSSMSGGGRDLNEKMDSPDIENYLLECRSVRIGSYKAVPCDKVLLTEVGLKLKVPNLNGEVVTIKILKNELVKVLVYFGQDLPVMFYYITAVAGRKICSLLKMTGKDGAMYFDPTSSEEVHKRITLLPDSIDEESRLFIKSIYDSSGLLGELDASEANEILLRAANQKDASNQNKKSISSSSTSASQCQEIQQIMIYPPPPIKGGISINTEDYACLGEDQFLNDVIIDFYLKYLVQNMLNEEDRRRTHVFSSFFYNRLTSNKNLHESNLSPAEKRHARVKGWTKGVNIFAKDFVIIPINESSHWFLAIICFPGLQGCVKMADNTPLPDDSGRREALGKKKNAGNIPNTIGETTITVVSRQISPTISLDPDCEERDEAEGNDEDLEPNSSDDESKENGDGNGELLDDAFPKAPKPQVPPKPTYPHQEAIKQPCILVFDSLMGASRSRVIATLREYLQIEYKVKHKGVTRDFSKDYCKGTVPKVPQQTNFTDCGLYVLQYVEEFFRNPLTDYRMPLKLQDWFQSEIVSRKRYEIQQLLHKLMDEQGVDRDLINLPWLNLKPDGKMYSDGDMDEEHMEMDEDMAEEEMPEDEEEEEEEERVEEEEEDEHEVQSQISQHLTLTQVTPQVSSLVSLTPQVSLNQQNMIQASTPQQVRARGSGPHYTTVRSPARPRTPVNKVLPVTPAPRTPNATPRQQLVRPNVLLESRSSTPQPTKRNVLLSSNEVTICKRPNLSPAPPTPPIQVQRPQVSTPNNNSSNLPHISSSVKITKRKV